MDSDVKGDIDFEPVVAARSVHPKRRSLLVEKLAKISRNVIKRRNVHPKHKRATFDQQEFGPLPPPDYYYQTDVFDVDEDEIPEDEPFGFSPVGRNAVEMASRFYVERNLFSYLAHTNIPSERNYYDDGEVDLSCLTKKPVSYLILGKPGIGKTTLARRLAAKLNAIQICPEEVIEYYRFQDVIHHLRVNEVLDSGGTIDDKIVAQLIQARVTELDVLHRGYVLDGFPMVNSEDLTVEEQIVMLENLTLIPQYVILLNMQDADLYKRRTEQKYDPITSKIYIREHYSKFNADANVFPTSHTHHSSNGYRDSKNSRMPAYSAGSDVAELQDFSESGTSLDSTNRRFNNKNDDNKEFPDPWVEDEVDGTKDFLPLTPEVLFRLITRTEDNPVLVNDDLEQFRESLTAMQSYVETFDKRKILELDAYWAPSVIYKRTYDFLESCGVTAVSVPVQIMRPLDLPIFRRSDPGEFLGEDDDSEAPCPDDEPPPEIDWESVMRAVSVRGLVDPRFRWRISRWQNLCPVALKYGRSIVGKPELATSYLDKIFFMSSTDAAEQFIFNPRPYLLPKMPTSPIKFFVLGHPLAGKTTFSKELAFMTNSHVIDMNREMEKKYGLVKHDYLYKKRVQYTLEAKLMIDKENHKEWKIQERARRAAMHAWIEEYIRNLAEAEIRAALEADRERRKAERISWRKESEFHKLQFPVHTLSCQGDDGFNKFCWRDFVAQVNEGKTSWTHQELLELAWDLFHQRKLYYKLFKRDNVKMTVFGDVESEEGEFGLVSEIFGGDSSEESDEELGEVEEEIEMPVIKPIKKRRRRRHCKKLQIRPDDKKYESDIEEEELLSSDIDPNDNELEESIRMRYPTIPTVLVDIIPSPTGVSEKHPRVEDIVSRRLEEDEKYVHSLPAELYIEVLRRSCAEVEAHYHQHHSHGPLTGGWVVENLMTDIEKWRVLLRTPEICPDQVFLLLDHSENRANIYGRLKKIFKLANPPRKKTKQKSMEMIGEGGFMLDEPEDDIDIPPELNARNSDFLQSLLPTDNLIDPLQDSPSNLLQILMDAQRERTPASEAPDDLEALLTQHERSLLEQIRSKTISQDSTRSYESTYSDNRRKQIAAEFKSLNYEMITIVKEGDYSAMTPLGVTPAEDIRENVRIMTEYLRHSRELESLSYSQGVHPQNDTNFLGPDSGNEDEEMSTTIPEDGLSKTAEDSNSTPDGLRSVTAITDDLTTNNQCSDDGLTEDEKAKCFREQQQQKIESPKRRFFIQIRLFDEFWNMAMLVCKEQGVKSWEVGLIDEDNAREKALYFWDQIESRFEFKAKKISENELREEDEEIHESLMKWGEPYEHNNTKAVPGRSKESIQPSRNKTAYDDTDEEESSGNYDSEADDLREDRDILAHLESKPDLYWKTVKKIEAQRCFGDMKYYCPVTLAEFNILRKGSSQFASKYRERLYYCEDNESLEKFIQVPTQYLSVVQPKSPPPPRICVTGSPGCGQEAVAVKMAKEYNICYVNFRQRLHELMKARFGKDIGPNKTGRIVSRYDSEKIISKCRSGDDLLLDQGTEETETTENDYDETEGEGESEIEHKLPMTPQISEEDITIDDAALRSLGLIDTADIKTVPIGSIERTERLTERKWRKLTKIESYVQAFLENGVQLPDQVLDEFIAPLWKEAPFNQVGFILVGFPNTEADIKYLIKNKFYPERVYLLECHSLVIRNRLLIETVDLWHHLQNPSGERKKRFSENQRYKAKALSSNSKNNTLEKRKGFRYQLEGRPEIDEFEKETWTYNDRISARITKALKHYHAIYSKGIRSMKQSLNRNRIDWMPINTNASVFGAKLTLIEDLTPLLKHRSSVFEDTVRLNLRQANALLNRGIFESSKFQRWCPVERLNGNTAVNLWNAPGVEKIPILYRRYIYFLAGEKNAKLFEQDCLQLVNQPPTMNTVPAIVVVMGPPKSGKTTLAMSMAQRLGLQYISGTEIINSVIKHSFASQWAELLNEMEPTILADGPQAMTLSEEVLDYARSGHTIPKFLVYRALDLAMMQPKAQYHGVVFDDYPVTEEELQELLYRGVVPSTVIKLNIEKTEGYERCRRNRKMDYNYVDIPEEGNLMIDVSNLKYDEASETTIFWFQHEVQNLIEIDGTQNIEWIFQTSAQQCKNNMKKMQHYLVNVILEIPSTLEGTCPLTSQIPLRLSPDFGFYCPVALNENDDLIRVFHITDLSEVVEYKGYVYLFSSRHNARKFMANPKKYTPPDCRRTPPKEVPITCLLTASQFEELKTHWGFMDFDPVRYYDTNHSYKGLQRGDPKLCVAYRNKLYCFINQENMKQFMKKPDLYWNQLLPLKVPRKTEPMDMEKVTSYSYLIAKGVLSEVKKVIQLTGEKRPRVPFMDLQRCAALFMGYYFKAQNMNATYEIRQKYRNAMFEMMTTKTKTKKFLSELHEYYGCRLKTLPERMKLQLDDFIRMERAKDEEKVLVPTIAGCVLQKNLINETDDEFEITLRYQNVKQMLFQADVTEKIEAFDLFSERKKAADDNIKQSERDRSTSGKLNRTST